MNDPQIIDLHTRRVEQAAANLLNKQKVAFDAQIASLNAAILDANTRISDLEAKLSAATLLIKDDAKTKEHQIRSEVERQTRLITRANVVKIMREENEKRAR